MNEKRPLSDYARSLGYRRLDVGIACLACGTTYRREEGSVMRGHRRRCPVEPREVYTPAVCDS